MLINLRNAMMAGKRLPYDAEVEYLESDGSSFIDTGVFGTNNTRIVVSIHTVSAQGAPFGSRRSTSSDRLDCLFAGDGTSGYCGYGSRATNVVSFSGTSLGDNTFDLNLGSLTINGNYKGSVQFDSFTTPTTIKLFCNETNGVRSQFFSGYIYYCKIYVNGVLVRDYIPVRKGTVGYLYDRVSGKLFGNAGTGDFVLGQDVVPVEWLRSSGSQWIDTGVVPAANDTYTVETRKLDARQDNASFGLAAVVYCFANPTGTFWCHPALGAGGRNGTNPLGNTNWHTIVASPTSVSVDGVALGDRASDAQSPLSTVKLFARGNNSASGGVAKNYNGMISHVLVNRGGSDLRKFYSVRVGTEGAMMDVLTRRIYRNAGTGAFAYGNDLKYPIPAE